MDIGDIRLRWLGHAGFFIKNSRTIYIDPYQIPDGMEKADLIFITHSHYDHCSVEDLMKIVQEGTRIVLPADCQSKVLRFNVPVKIEIVEPGQELDLQDVKVSVFPSYNVDKPFHPKEEGWVGYVIKMKNVVFYHAGDTDNIPEMQKLTGFNKEDNDFIALLPVGGRFTMTAEEAVEAAGIIKPTLAIPMHYGVVSGTDEDAKEFFALCMEQGLNAKVLEKE